MVNVILLVVLLLLCNFHSKPRTNFPPPPPKQTYKNYFGKVVISGYLTLMTNIISWVLWSLFFCCSKNLGILLS